MQEEQVSGFSIMALEQKRRRELEEKFQGSRHKEEEKEKVKNKKLRAKVYKCYIKTPYSFLVIGQSQPSDL